MASVVALTPSAGRPWALAQCREYMARQTVPVRHLVVEQDASFPENLLRCLELGLETDAEWFIVAEDDDWYPATYVEDISAHFRPDLAAVGYCRSRYYHVPTGWFMEWTHRRHACLAATALARDTLETVAELARKGRTDVDIQFWRFTRQLRKHLIEDVGMVGLKGLPGRAGVAAGHTPSIYPAQDLTGKILRDWLGEDAARYEAIRWPA